MINLKYNYELLKQHIMNDCIVFTSDLEDNYTDTFSKEEIKAIKTALSGIDIKGNQTIKINDMLLVNVGKLELNTESIIIVKRDYGLGTHQKYDPFLSKYRALIDALDDKIVVVESGTAIHRNPALSRFIGLNPNKIDQKVFQYYLTKDSINRLGAFLRKNEPGEIELEMNTLSSGLKNILVDISVIYYMDTRYLIGNIRDITDITKRNIEIEIERNFFLHTLDSIDEGVIICDQEGIITRFNNNASEMTGYDIKEATGKTINHVLTMLDQKEHPIDCLNLGHYKSDAIVVSKDGMYWQTSVNVSEIVNTEKEVVGKVIILIDINEQKKREEEILYLSYHDVLTGLYNRTFLEEEIRRLDTKRQLPFAIIMGDVNGLKLTNDVFGHEAGDALLRKVSKILKHLCRNEDIVGRWGGDEFIILLPQTAKDVVEMIIKRIVRYFDQLTAKDTVNGVIPSISLGYGIKLNPNDSIMNIMKIAETNMYRRKMLSKSSMHSKLLISMQNALYAKSQETEEHANRLYKYCKLIGEKYGLKTSEFDELELVCKLHDLGKIGVDDRILNKPGPLTKSEWEQMKQHPEIGFRIAQATPELQKVANYILCHHEHYDGSGYPRGIKGHDIPLLARILSVVDAYDAMTTKRIYNEVKTKKQAVKEIKEHAGTQFDPDVVNIFTSIIE